MAGAPLRAAGGRPAIKGLTPRLNTAGTGGRGQLRAAVVQKMAVDQLLGRLSFVAPHLPVAVRIGQAAPITRVLLGRLLPEQQERRATGDKRAEAVELMRRRRPAAPPMAEGAPEKLVAMVQASSAPVLAPAAVAGSTRDPKGKAAARERKARARARRRVRARAAPDRGAPDRGAPHWGRPSRAWPVGVVERRPRMTRVSPSNSARLSRSSGVWYFYLTHGRCRYCIQ